MEVNRCLDSVAALLFMLLSHTAQVRERIRSQYEKEPAKADPFSTLLCYVLPCSKKPTRPRLLHRQQQALQPVLLQEQSTRWHPQEPQQ